MRVQLHPGTDRWMRGDRYGTIVKVGAKKLHVKMDRSGQTISVLPENIMEAFSANPGPIGAGVVGGIALLGVLADRLLTR